MSQFNHAYAFGFELVSDREDGDVPGWQLREALLRRVASMGDAELAEACGCPVDTFEEDAA